MTDRPTSDAATASVGPPYLGEITMANIHNFTSSAYTAELDPGLFPEPTGRILIRRIDELAERSETQSQQLSRMEGNLRDLLGAVQALGARMDKAAEL